MEVEGRPTPKHLGAARVRGVDLDDGPASAKSVRIVDARPGRRGSSPLVMTEGRKREVRRLLAAVGLPGAPAGPRPHRPDAARAPARRARSASSPPTRCSRSASRRREGRAAAARRSAAGAL